MVVCVLCGSLFCFSFGFVFGVFFVVCFLFFVFRFLHSKCDKGSGLCIGPLPVYFCGHYSFGPCTSQLINLICNMLGNMLNDLAEAIRRWTEKKPSPFCSMIVPNIGTSIVALRLTCARLHFHVSGAKRPLAANSSSDGNSGWSFVGNTSSLITNFSPCSG